MERRVFLLEFVNADQSPGRISESLPFIAGRLSELGIPLRWLRFAISTTNLFENASDHVTLSEEEAARLRAALAEFRPTSLICTDALSPALRAEVLALAPGARLHESFAPATESLLRLLDRPGFWPRYDWEPGNEAASRKDIDNIYLNHLDDCGYRRCTFCLSFAAEPPPQRTPASWYAKQIEAVARSRAAAGRLPHAVLLSCLSHPDVLDLCLEGLHERGMDGVKLLMAVRTNQIASVVRLLRARFARHPDSRIGVGIYASGVESFDGEELKLYNKGTRPLDGLRAVNDLRELAADFPDRFSYEGLSFLLFTPWTTLESLELNYGIIRHLGMGDDRSNLYQCRLRLHPEIPLTALAEQHGLVVEEEPDPVLVMNRRKLFTAERAWRFADPRVRPVSRLVLRYDLLGTPMADELTRSLERRLLEADPSWRRRGGDGDFLLGFTLCAIAAARAEREPLDEQTLLERAAALWRAGRASPRASSARVEAPPERLRSAHPEEDRAWVFSFDGTEAAGLIVSEADDDSVSYDPSTVAGEGRLADLLRGGRRLLLVPGQIRIVSGKGGISGVLTVTHGLWWPKRSWHAAEWAELARAAARPPAAPRPSGEGVVLVEFAALGRFTLGVEFPFLHSWLKRALDVPVLWLRFALDPAARFGGEESGMSLGEADTKALLDAFRGFPAKRVLFSFRPAESLWSRIRAEHPSASARFLSDEEVDEEAPAGDPRPAALPSGDAALLRWLGVKPRPGLGSFLESEPDFGFAAGNREAREMPPLAFVLGGEECVYRRSVASNPAYAGVDLAGCRTEGCAFCVSGGRESGDAAPVSAEPAVEGAMRQVHAFYRTYPLPDGGVRPRLRMSGQKLLLEVEALADRMAELKAPPSDLLFDGRIDYLLRLEPRLRKAAERLKGTGHKLHVCLVGLENFSGDELLRLNKGVTPAQNLAAIRALRRVERDHPAEFGFEEHGGLSTILFTPWTSLEDLALNFAVARHFRLEKLCGKLLTSRVRLYERLPLTALARRDGLLVDGYEDEALDTARRNFYPDELAWRFRHPEVEAVSRVATRMARTPALERDPLYAKVQTALAGPRAAGLSYVESACALLDRALAHPGRATPEELLASWSGAAAAGRTAPDPNPDSDGESDLSALLRAQREGRSRVNRQEMLADEGAAGRLAASVRAGGAFALAVPRRQHAGAGETWDVFFGPRREDVEEAARLTDLQYEPGAGKKKLADARRRLGELYGYPPCCAAAFAATDHSSPTANSWLLLLRRCEHPGPIDPSLTPYAGGIKHVPCSVRCGPSVERARGGSDNPVLFLLDRIDEFVELVPRSPVGRTFEFSAGAMCGADPALRALAGGGTIDIGEGIVSVRRDGARVACFPLRAAVWWHGQAFDPEFWRECALEHLERREAPAAPPDRRPERVERAPLRAEPRREAAPPSAALAGIISSRLSGAARLAGYAVESVEPGPGRYAVVTLKSPAGGVLVVNVEPREGAERFFKAAGDLAFGYSQATPLSTKEQVAAMAALIARLTARGRASPSAAEAWEPGADAWEGRLRETRDMLAFKPVTKIEPVREAELKGWRDCGLPNLVARRRGTSRVWELFTGRRREDVERAAALTARQRGRASQEGVVEELGRLLGYPACCARAYARQPRAVMANSFWSFVANRVAEPGPVPPEFSPLNVALEYFPCSLSCAASVERSGAVLAASPTLAARVEPARWRNPFLLVLGEQGSGVELICDGEPDARIRYRAGEVFGRGADVEAAAAGDELVLGEGSVSILRGGRTLADLSGRAFVWWHRKAFQAEHWRAAPALRAAPERSPRKPPRDRAALSRALAAVDAEFERRVGVPCRGRRVKDRLAVTIAGRSWELILETGGDGPAFARAGALRVCVKGRRKMSPAEEKRLKAYALLLARRGDELAGALSREETGRKRRPK